MLVKIITIIYMICNLIVCVGLLPFPPCAFFPSLKVLLMQESVRRIIETEESRMGKMCNVEEILARMRLLSRS